MLALQSLPEASLSLKNVLESEWLFTKQICPHVIGGEAEAGKRFRYPSSHYYGITYSCLKKIISVFKQYILGFFLIGTLEIIKLFSQYFINNDTISTFQ